MTDLERARRYFLSAIEHTTKYRLFTMIGENGEMVPKPILVTAKRLAVNSENWDNLIRKYLGIHPNANIEGKHIDMVFFSEVGHNEREFYDVAIVDAEMNKGGDEMAKSVDIQVPGTNIRFFFIQVNKDKEGPYLVNLYDHRKMAKVQEEKTGLDD